MGSTATDASGNVYVAGTAIGYPFGDTSSGILDAFLIKYDASGTELYTRQLGVSGLNYTFGRSTATDASGNVYVAGSTNGGLDGNTLIGVQDAFLTKYDASGNKLYTRQLGVAGGSTVGWSTATDASGKVYVAGSTNGGLDGNTLAGVQDAFLTKYDASGSKLYTRQLGVAGAHTEGWSTATDASGNVYVAGSTNGGLDGNTPKGLSDAFLIKYDASGDRL